MPKMKSHRGIAKRIKVTGSGELRLARRVVAISSWPRDDSGSAG